MQLTASSALCSHNDHSSEETHPGRLKIYHYAINSLDEFPPNYDRYVSKALSLQSVAEELIILNHIIRVSVPAVLEQYIY
jgi:hypothetical protein